MRKLLLAVLLLLLTVSAGFALELEAGKDYFVRTALHAVRGDEIYWVNYTDTAKTILIPSGDKVTITEIDEHIIKLEHQGKSYNFAFTEKRNKGTGELYAKFFTADDVASKIRKYPEDIRSKIKRGIAEKGMTKEQLLFAVGCPAVVDGQKTFNLSLKEIMSSDKWIYYFNRFNRWQAVFKDGRLVDILN